MHMAFLPDAGASAMRIWMAFLPETIGLLLGGHTPLECGVHGHWDVGDYVVRHLLRSGGFGHPDATPRGTGSTVDDVVATGVRVGQPTAVGQVEPSHQASEPGCGGILLALSSRFSSQFELHVS
jgi:hypothetical protein